MAQTGMTLHGMEHTLRQLARAPEVVRKHAAGAVGYSVIRVAQAARALVSVDTGFLKSDINYQHKDGTLTGFIGTRSEAAFYWYPLEMGYMRGGKQIAARPFFRPAAEQESASFINQVRDIGPAVEHEMESRGMV